MQPLASNKLNIKRLKAICLLGTNLIRFVNWALNYWHKSCPIGFVWLMIDCAKIKEGTHILVSQAVHEERMACAVMWCDGDDDVLINQDGSYDVSDSIRSSIHFRSSQRWATSGSKSLTKHWLQFHHEDCDDGGDYAGDRSNWIDSSVCYRSMCCCW